VTSSKNRKSLNAFWPDTSTQKGVDTALKSAAWACGFVAVITVAAVSFSVFVNPILALDAWGYIDAVIFGVCAFGISRGSRTAAIFAIAFYLLNRYLMFEESGQTGGFVAILIVLMLINGIRGAFAHHASKQEPEHWPDET
jgi:uncharacterized BrkB/YihY/UPF0761 family membrane protein